MSNPAAIVSLVNNNKAGNTMNEHLKKYMATAKMDITFNGDKVALQYNLDNQVKWDIKGQQLTGKTVLLVIDGNEPIKVAAYGGPNYYDFYFQAKCGKTFHCNNGYIGLDNLWQNKIGDIIVYVLTSGVDVADKAGILS